MDIFGWLLTIWSDGTAEVLDEVEHEFLYLGVAYLISLLKLRLHFKLQISRKDAFDFRSWKVFEYLILNWLNNTILLNLHQVPLQTKSTEEFQVKTQNNLKASLINLPLYLHLFCHWKEYIHLEPLFFICEIIYAWIYSLFDCIYYLLI